ncbi:rod-binding protein [Hellea sp.]|nr:rod-binding protein [Hellea sp.]
MFSQINPLQLPYSDLPDATDVAGEADQKVIEAELRKSAQNFEAAYIAQMLTFSGLDKALMAGGGEEVAAFTSFYIESFADQIAEKGGFGLAENFYGQMVKLSGLTHEQNDFENNGEIVNVDFGKL